MTKLLYALAALAAFTVAAYAGCGPQGWTQTCYQSAMGHWYCSCNPP